MTNISHIREMATGEEIKSIRHHYSDDELAALREKFTDGAIRLSDEEDSFLLVKKEWKLKLDDLKSGQKEKRLLLRNRYFDQDMSVYKVPNFETSMMEFYDTLTGELVEERRLRPDEKQMNILQAKAV